METASESDGRFGDLDARERIIAALPVAAIKRELAARGVSFAGLFEKSELVAALRRRPRQPPAPAAPPPPPP